MSKKFRDDLLLLVKYGSFKDLDDRMNQLIPLHSVIQYRQSKDSIFTKDLDWKYAVRIEVSYDQDDRFQFGFINSDGVVQILSLDEYTLEDEDSESFFSDLDENVKVIKTLDNFADAFNYLRNLSEGCGAVILKEI